MASSSSSSSSPEVGSEAWKAQDQGHAVVALCWAFTALSSFFVAARLSVRGSMGRKLQLDDYLMIAALSFSCLSTTLTTLAVTHGYGKHTALLSASQREASSFYTVVALCPGILSFTLPKLAAIHLLTRLLNPSKRHKWFLWAVGLWTLLSLLTTCGLLIGRCYPAEAQWDRSVPGTCLSLGLLVDFSYYSGALSAVVDIYLAVYPTIVLWKLQMNRRKKIALSCTLGLGFISAIVALYKLTRLPSLLSADFSYDTADLLIWTIVEGGIIIIVCSVPVLQPLLDRFVKRASLSSHLGHSKRHPWNHNNNNNNNSRRTGQHGGADYDHTHNKTTTRAASARKLDHLQDFDFASTPSFDAARGQGLSRSTTVVSRHRSSSSIDCGGGAALSRKTTAVTDPESEKGGILLTKVVTISFSDRNPSL